MLVVLTVFLLLLLRLMMMIKNIIGMIDYCYTLYPTQPSCGAHLYDGSISPADLLDNGIRCEVLRVCDVGFVLFAQDGNCVARDTNGL